MVSHHCNLRATIWILQVLNASSALLSNYEVLTLLRELDSDHIARTKTAIRIKKEEDSAGHTTGRGGYDPTTDDVSENLRTVEVEVCGYSSPLCMPFDRERDNV